MTSVQLRVIFGLVFPLAVSAQPAVDAVTDPVTYKEIPFTQGEVVIVFGSGMGSSPTVTVGGQAAYIIYGSNTQVNLQLPVSLTAGPNNLVVTNGAQSSNPYSITIVTYAPVLSGQIIHSDGSLVNSSKPAVPNEVLTAYALGLGPVTSQPPAGSYGPTNPYSYTTSPVTVTFGGENFAANSAYLSPSAPEVLPGEYAVQFTVPSGVISGSVQLTVSVNGQTSNSVGVAYTDPNALSFVPITPCRAVDTRNPDSALGGPSINGGASRSFAIAGNACGIPANAQAYSLNAAIVPTSNGYMTLWPTGQPQPGTASVNSPDGAVHSNGAIVPAGTGGAISVFALDTMDVVLDVNGYFVTTSDNPSALAFYPVTPCRTVDTRNANGDLGGPFLSGGSTRDFPIMEAALACNIATAAQAYSLNIAVVPRTGTFHYLTAWAADTSQPTVATLNDPQGVNHSNGAIVPAATDGTGGVDVYVTNDADLVIDINGYFAPPGTGGLSLYPLQPCRVLDTRQPAGSQPFTGTLPVNVAGSSCGVPSAAQAYVFNATVVPDASHGYLTLWQESAAQPTAANLNDPNGVTTGNMAIVPTTNGSIEAYFAGTGWLILDIFGYFAP